jgi:hypothetical protein
MSEFKKDILTASRVMFALRNADIDTTSLGVNNIISYFDIISTLDNKELRKKIFNIVRNDQSNDEIKTINLYFIYLMGESLLFTKEINRRIEHAKKVGVYADDSEEDLERKRKESKDIYPSEYYMSCFILLSKNGIDTKYLNISECLMAMENIICDEINNATNELLGYVSIEDSGKSFAESIRKIVKHANFYAFAIDIYNEVNEKYNRIQEKKERK